jgi:AcrR family transcriptional regulator
MCRTTLSRAPLAKFATLVIIVQTVGMSMSAQTTTSPRASRRDRLRRATIEEIKSRARAQLATQGVGALSLRAIAREMGMASSAIYRYYPSRDDLVSELCAEAYASIAAALARARDARPADDHAGRWRALCHAYRQWSLDYQSDFTLIFGAPLPGYQAPEEITGPPSSAFAAVPFGVYAAAVEAGDADPDRTLVAPAADVGDLMRDLAPAYPPRLALIVLNAWASLHGYVALECLGGLTRLAQDTSGLFEAHVGTVMLGMGFDPALVDLRESAAAHGERS